jgi:hypothetical protein
VRTPNPPGNLKVSGVVGPFESGHIGETPLCGDFRLADADLSTYKAIAGNLFADGTFEGRLADLRLVGRAHIPNFEVTSSRHSLGLSVEYQTAVNATDGDITLQSAKAHFRDTTLLVKGTIAGQQGKVVSLLFNSNQARIQDLLRLFVRADRPPLEGPMNLTAQVLLPPGHRPFLQKLQLNGRFTISDGEFTNRNTQDHMDEFSIRARGKSRNRASPQHTTAELSGEVKLRDGVAKLSSALLTVPGAFARANGTYDLTTKRIDLKGKLTMHASLSKAVGGAKSILLIPLDPFFKTNGAGAVVPVKMTGTYAHPRVRLSFMP